MAHAKEGKKARAGPLAAGSPASFESQDSIYAGLQKLTDV
jgi:hypothetical protein